VLGGQGRAFAALPDSAPLAFSTFGFFLPNPALAIRRSDHSSEMSITNEPMEKI